MKALRYGLVAAVLALCAVPALALAQEEQPDPEAMMKAYMEKSMPGPGHAFLANLAGDYTYTMTTYDDPAHPATFTGTATKTMLMGGRYLEEKTSGEMMGMPFDGMGVTTFNNATKKYETVWFDNMSSSLLTCTDGTLDGNTMTMKFQYLDPVTNQNAKVKTVTQVTDEKHHTMTYFMTMPDGSEMKMFDIAYTKK